MRYSKVLSMVISTAKTLHFNNEIIHSNNKIETTWSIIRSETGGNNIKYDKLNILNTDKRYNKSVNAENFNNHFCAKYCLIYLRYFIFPLPTLFSIIHLWGKLKKSFTPSLGKIHVGMMKFQ